MANRGNQDSDFRDFDFDNDDEPGGEFSFDDQEDNVNLDDDFFGDDGGSDDGGFDDGDDTGGSSGGGPSRTFVIIAAVMVIILLLVGGLLVALATGVIKTQLSDFEVQSTHIAETNAAVAILIEQTNAAGTEVFFITQTAESFTETPTPTASMTATNTPDTLATQTALAQSVQQTGTALALTSQVQPTTAVPVGGDITNTPSTGGGVNTNNVLGTATALAQTLQAQRTGVATTTGGGIGGGPTATTNPNAGAGGGNALPDTGLFDDIGGGGPGMMLLLGIGLLGIIAISRGARTVNKGAAK